jgi:hypothetical protein
LWAPEVKFYRGRFYLTYSGLVRGSPPNQLRIGLAVSDTPEGPFRDLHTPLLDPGYSTIDGHLFVDDDGTPYLYFSRNGGRDGYSYGANYAVQLERDLSRPVGKPILVGEASQPWERVKWAENRCNEGMTVLQRNGRYYMTYSANHTGFPHYGVGYATAEKPLGPWTKAEENPILATKLEIGVSAPGHNSIVRSPDGKEWFIVYHSHADPQKPSSDRVVNLDRLEFTADGKLRVKGPTRSPQPLPSGVAGAVVATSATAGNLVRGARDSAGLLLLDNGAMKTGLDPAKGGSITWLSWTGQPTNVVNQADPGRLIQQSYYAGHRLDRRSEGQAKAWSPWTWNPIQGGGVGSWARVTEMKRLDDGSLYAETVPRLWDMPGEEAAARMRQWTAFEPGTTDVVVVRCEIICQRSPEDRWGPAAPRPQEIPACYFTRNFSAVQSFLGEGKWRAETQPPGPPWGKAQPPRKAMACFAPNGQGVAVFSPASTLPWNFGPHGGGASDDSSAGPCMHVAPIDRAALGPRSVYRYRYWLIVGSEAQIAARLETLWAKYQGERAEVSEGR